MTTVYAVVHDQGYDGQMVESIAADVETAKMVAEAYGLQYVDPDVSIFQREKWDHVGAWEPDFEGGWVVTVDQWDNRMRIQPFQVIE